MKAIKTRRDKLICLFMAGIFVAAWFALVNEAKVAFGIGLTSMVLLPWLLLENRRLRAARLIWENRILTVAGEKGATETVVSTFGALVGSRVYKWGWGGVALLTVELDKERICLAYGEGEKISRLELAHGISNIQLAMEVKQKFWYETGVSAVLHGWQENTPPN
ncbi:hypothetical protein SDC9_192039 [bioreactor metagenome]|uniref:Uncharacterized protein n=1 Tax=bioreactor metagenome TaxID=1076179 RepID=A0A645I832_9ZZZZ|nr:hypothetical protein [Candidatus Pelethousia sp.]NCB29926.1 hypothetical protein [Clostridia bacterium]